jgi:hypothetical protein
MVFGRGCHGASTPRVVPPENGIDLARGKLAVAAMSPTPVAASRGSRLAAWLALAVVGAFVLTDAAVRSRHTLETSARYGVTVDAPAIEKNLPTGYADGRRSLVLPVNGADTAHWIMQTQTEIARGEWRVRHVDYDNPPGGREVHWAAPFHAWLAAVATVDHFVSGQPWGISVERAALWAGPAMLVVLLALLGPLVWREFSPPAAALTAVGAVATFAFYIDFIPGNADHHGLANSCGLFLVLGLLAAGLARETSGPAGVRRWIVVSAVAGSVGLWVSAATLVPVLIGVGLGLLAAMWFARGADSPLVWVREPNLLRRWGLIGGGASFAAYLVEYFPSHLGMRLEVNHPLYAVAWIGAGEALRVAALAARDGGRTLGRRELVLGAGGVALVALLPLVIFATTADTFAVADPFLWRLHARYISEFQGIARHLASHGAASTLVDLGLPALLLLLPGALLGRSDISRELKALAVFAEVPALLGWLMGWAQMRWLSLAFALTIPVLALFFRALRSSDGGARLAGRWALACGLLFVPGAIGAVQRTLASTDFSREEILGLAERDVAHWLRQRAGGERVVVAAAPSPTTRLIYHGGLTGVGTLYWENAEGLRHASALFAAHSADEAHEIVRRLGITHIVLFSWDAFEIVQAKLYRDLPEDTPIPADLFVANLLTSAVPPPWLRAVPFLLPKNDALANDQVRIWEVVPDQTPAAAVAHATNYYLELGKPDLAQRFAPPLAEFPDDLAAATMRAGLASRARDEAAFREVFARVLALLPQADSLAPDDRIHLVVVLAVGQQVAPAQEQLRACLRQLDARALRALTPGTLSDLLALADALGVDFPDAATKQLAQRLLPPSRRAR